MGIIQINFLGSLLGRWLFGTDGVKLEFYLAMIFP